MEFRILGALEVSEGGRSLPLGGTKQRAVLAVLLLHADEVVSTERLIDDVWERPPATVKAVLQGYISKLRKALPPETLLTRGPGYLLRLEPHELDLRRFERLVEEADNAAPALAAGKIREALALWRGPPLADFAEEPFAQAAVARLEELRLLAIEKRIAADLELGRQAEVVAELEGVIAEHPLRERLRGQLMLALYRSGRQAEALGAYREARRTLVDELGIEPSPALQELERAILRQDPALESAHSAAPERSILVLPLDEAGLDVLLRLAEPLAQRPPREVILARPVAETGDLGRTAALVHKRRETMLARGFSVRAAAFVSQAPGEDIVRLATEERVDLLLVDGAPELLEEAPLATLLAQAPCDVGVLFDRDQTLAPGPVLVPFAGTDNDWAAVELAAWIAGSQGVPLRLAGPAGGGRDASRLLARASLLAQRVLGVAAEPLLVDPGEEGLLRVAGEAALLVLGVPGRLGEASARLAVARQARLPTLLVRKGLRPGGLAPAESYTRFTWTLGKSG